MFEKFKQLNLATQMRIVEAIIFASEEPVSIENLHNNLNTLSIVELNLHTSHPVETEFEIGISNTPESYLLQIIKLINEDLDKNDRPYRIVEVAEGYTFATNEKYGRIVSLLPAFRNKKKLTKSQLETLSIIAYNQPITKSEIEKVRGVNSSEVVNSLLEKNLITILGRKNTLGKPLLYGTTKEFLKLFGLNNLDDLPKLNEIKNIIEEQNKSKLIEIKIDFDESKHQEPSSEMGD
jgi:segregation and condensation protein B